MGRRRSTRRKRVQSHPPHERPATPAAPSRWRWGVALWCLGAVALLGVPYRTAPTGPGADPASGPATGAANVRIALVPVEPVSGAVSIRVLAGGEEVERLDVSLPHELTLTRGLDVLLIVEQPGRARFVRWLHPEADEELRVPLGPGARLAGLVVDDLGEPVVGAVVRIEREGEELPPWQAATGDDGRFDIDTLYAGAHGLTASSPNHGTIVRQGVSPDGTELRITLERVGSVAGRVVDPDGAPRAGAFVVIAGSGIWPARRTQTDSEGRFRWADVPPGVYELRAHAGDLVADPRRGLEVEPHTRAFVTFTLQHGRSLTGTVVDTDTGDPVEGAQITVSAEALDVAPRATTSDPRGHFAIAGLQAMVHRVSVYAEGYVPVTALEHTPGDLLTLSLVPGGILVGVVLDQQRRPVAGATIEVLGEREDRQPVELTTDRGFRGAVFASQLDPIGPGMALAVTEGPVPPIPLAPAMGGELELLPLPEAPDERTLGSSHITDEEGTFRIIGVPPGHVQIVAHHAGYAPATTARLFIAAGATRDGVELILAPGGRLIGRVIDEREVGVEGVLVEIRSDREPHPRIAFTDDRGAFELQGVVGELSVTALPNGRPAVRARVTVASGADEEVILALEGELYRLRGRTVDRRGFPVGGVQLTVTTLRADAPYRGTLFSEDDGTFVGQNLPRGPWRIEATASGYAPVRVDAFDTTEELEVALEPGARVSGSVLDDYSGEPVRARVTLSRDDLPAEHLSTRTSEEGTWAIPRARMATWSLLVESEDHLTHESMVEVQEARGGPRDVELDPIRLTPGGRLEGTVVDALGHPVARARVRGGESTTRCDARGRFSLSRLAAGELDVVASHPAAGESEPASFRVLAGRETPGVVLHLPERYDPRRAAELAGRRRGVALEVGSADGEVRVRRVIEGSHAQSVGLRRGDVLVEIDGATPHDAREARDQLRGAEGVGAILRVRRDDREVVLHVQRESWLPD